jgi:putative membrane protein
MALVLGLSACSSGSNQTASDTGNSAQNASESMGNAAGNAMMDVKEAVTPTPSAQEFIDKAAKSDAFEIAAAKVAESKATSAAVKSFAKEMVTDHTASTTKIKAAAKKAEPALTPSPTLTDDQSKMLADLKAKTGTDFDKAYVSGQVDAHKDALTLMQGYAKNGDTASLKIAAADIAPIVQKHLDMARALDK